VNKLEKAIIEGVKTAQKDYCKMTGGWWWLSHGPESFLQHAIAIKIHKQENYCVYPEASPKKIMKERDDPLRGRPPKNLDQRFDLVVWDKSTDNLRAILEIKRAWSIADLKGDREKIETYIKQNKFVKNGYLVAYSEAKSSETLKNRLMHWANRLNCNLVNSHISPSDGEWVWAIGLLKIIK
jgi:hypothetical protein